MSDLSGQYQKLPPGWDCKYDQTTGNCYYINYFTKAMQLEDPRTRYKQLQNERCSTESIPLQQMHGGSGSPYHVYPSNNPPAIRAFQTTANSSLNNMSSTPLLTSRTQLQELSPVPFLKSATALQTSRLGNMTRRSTIQETSFTNQQDTDAVVAKIQNMFPTAGENHIRLLLKRYYNREAVVISALQVEKHPVTMPGPFVTPPAQRHLYHSNSAFYMTPPARRLVTGYTAGAQSNRTISPCPVGRFGSVMSMHSSGKCVEVPSYAVGAAAVPIPVVYHGSPRFGEQWRSSPKPHSSPKMKLRYMKNIFPKADEMLLLDILANADNNVQTASEQLIALGYVKRDFTAPKQNNRPPVDENRPDDGKIILLRPKDYTEEEKESMQQLLKEKYPKIAEKIILMALESVNYAEDRAMQILQIVQEEDDEYAKKQKQKQKKNTKQLQSTFGMPDESELDGMTGGADHSILTVVLETIAPNSNGNNNNNSNNNDNANENKHSVTDLELHKYDSSKQIPSINVTTPTTATTQIILSNSLNSHIGNDSPSFTAQKKQTPDHVIAQANAITKATTAAAAATTNKNKKLTMKRNSNTSITTTTTTACSSATTLHIMSLPPCSSSSSSSTSSCSSASASASASSSLSSSASSSFSTLPSSSKTFPTMTTKSILARNPYGTASNGVNIGHLHGTSSFSSSNSACSILEKLTTTRSRDKFDSLKDSQRESFNEALENNEQIEEFQSLMGRIKSIGHNTALAHGPDENLLLADYVTWNGANPDISLGHRQSQAIGADPTGLIERTYKPLGRNPELCKGPQSALAKGSIYAKLAAAGTSGTTANIKCN